MSRRAASPLHLPAGAAAAGGDPVRLSPQRAGWRYTGLDVIRLRPGESRAVDARGRELLVLPLSGACEGEVDGELYPVAGRADVFAAVSDFVYAPAGSRVRVASRDGGEFALPWAVADRAGTPEHTPADRVAREVRGAGRSTRQVNDLFTAGRSDAQRLIVVEVLTPAGNWSSYPPHKHDDAASGAEDELEEIYYFRVQGDDGFAVHRTYTADGELDETVVVRDGDLFLVPRGYHGPCAAPPEFALYYLNVLAGPGEARTLRFADDPAYAWIRASWRSQEPDARVPLTAAPRLP